MSLHLEKGFLLLLVLVDELGDQSGSVVLTACVSG